MPYATEIYLYNIFESIKNNNGSFLGRIKRVYKGLFPGSFKNLFSHKKPGP